VCVAENVDEVHRELTRLKATLAKLEAFKDPFKFRKGEGGRWRVAAEGRRESGCVCTLSLEAHA
jgi:hypothetical protein